jgi:hypothetical protein
VLKAAAAAAGEAGSDSAKQIHQQHFVRAIEDVLGAKSVMKQSLFSEEHIAPAADPVMQALQAMEARSRSAILIAFAVAGTALVAALSALAVVLLR